MEDAYEEYEAARSEEMKKRKTERRGQRSIAALGGRLKSNELLLVLVTWLDHSVHDRPIFNDHSLM